MLSKEEICDVAVRLFVEDGYDNTPMSSIARATGLSKAGLYHHFPSKEDLLFYIIDHLMEQDLSPIMDQAEAMEDPQQRLEFFVRSYTQLLISKGTARVVIHEARRLSAHNYRKIELSWQRVFRLVRGCVEQLQAQGRAKDLNQSFTTFALLGMCTWTFYWFDYARPQGTDELSDTYLEILLKGILA
jgi:AcrR family transcriptional regulator